MRLQEKGSGEGGGYHGGAGERGCWLEPAGGMGWRRGDDERTDTGAVSMRAGGTYWWILLYTHLSSFFLQGEDTYFVVKNI